MIEIMEFRRLGDAAERREAAVLARDAAVAAGDHAALERAIALCSLAELDFERALNELADA